jgi:hypothetical protein
MSGSFSLWTLVDDVRTFFKDKPLEDLQKFLRAHGFPEVRDEEDKESPEGHRRAA